MRDFVLDCSMVMGWVFEDEVDPEADAAYAYVRRGGLRIHVPAIFWPEVANTLLVAERRKRCLPGKAEEFLENVLSLPIYVDECEIGTLIRDIQGLAKNYVLTAYDACYLNLAVRYDLPLSTLDKPLKAAAGAAGVRLLKPD